MVSDTIESVCTQCVHFHSVLWIYIYSRIHMSARCRGRACARATSCAPMVRNHWNVTTCLIRYLSPHHRVSISRRTIHLQCIFDIQEFNSAWKVCRGRREREKYSTQKDEHKPIPSIHHRIINSLTLGLESSELHGASQQNRIQIEFWILLFLPFISIYLLLFFVFHWLFFFLSLVFWILFGIIFCLKCACLHSAIMYTNQIRKACNNQLVFCFYFQHWFVLWNLNGHWKCTIRDRASE